MQSVRRTSVLSTEVTDLADECGLRVIEDYAGEGTGGQPCLAVVGELGELIDFTQRVGDELSLEDACDDNAWTQVQVTSIGGEVTYFWPGIYVTADGEDDESDEDDYFADEDEDD